MGQRRSGTLTPVLAGIALAMTLVSCAAPQSADGAGTSIAGRAAGGAAQSASADHAGAPAHVVAVGDIASASGLDDDVAKVVARLHPDRLLLLGDIAYPDGSAGDFAKYFTPDWSGFSGIWMPVPGNHEYATADAAGFRTYFDVPTGPLYTSEQLGAWRVIGLDSETPTSQGQLTWLHSELAAHDGQPTLVAWHRPRYSSGEHGDQADTDALWNAIKDDPDVRLVLWGHDHDYERMAVPVAGRSPLTSMVVGTGGGELRATPLMVDRPWRDFYVDQVTGVLDLQLAAGSFTWSFVDVAGRVLDRGFHSLTEPASVTTSPRAVARVSATRGRSKLRVDVNPNKGSGSWTFRVQRAQPDGSWTPLKTYRTRGSRETRMVNLRRGTYRVAVNPKYGHVGSLSAPVYLTR